MTLNKFVQNLKNKAVSLKNNGFDKSQTREALKALARQSIVLDDNDQVIEFDTKKFDNVFGSFIRRLYSNQQEMEENEANSKIVKLNLKKETFETKENGETEISITNIPSNNFPTKEEILASANLDPNLFELGNIKRSNWQAQTPDGIEELSSLRVTAHPKEPTIEDRLDSLQKALEERPRLDLPAPRLDKSGDEIAIVAIPDLHLGKWADDYDCPEAINHLSIVKAYNQIIADAKSIIKLRPVEKILFYWSNDFFHYDTKGKTTTKGTLQDTDLSATHMFDLGVELLIKGINELAELAPVKTFYTMSNHDELTGAHAATVLQYAFRNNPNVEVNTDKSPRHYEQYGVNLFGFAHGDKEGGRIKTLMQEERPQMWGNTCYREYLLGHFHSLKLSEEGGIVFRYMQSPTGPDNWHTTSGYIGAWQCGTVLIRNKKYGPVFDMPLMVLKDRIQGRANIYKAQMAADIAA